MQTLINIITTAFIALLFVFSCSQDKHNGYYNIVVMNGNLDVKMDNINLFFKKSDNLDIFFYKETEDTIYRGDKKEGVSSFFALRDFSNLLNDSLKLFFSYSSKGQSNLSVLLDTVFIYNNELYWGGAIKINYNQIIEQDSIIIKKKFEYPFEGFTDTIYYLRND